MFSHFPAVVSYWFTGHQRQKHIFVVLYNRSTYSRNISSIKTHKIFLLLFPVHHLNCSFIFLFTYIHVVTNLRFLFFFFIYSVIYNQLFIYDITRPFTYSFIHSFVYCFIYSFVSSFIHSFVHVVNQNNSSQTTFFESEIYVSYIRILMPGICIKKILHSSHIWNHCDF